MTNVLSFIATVQNTVEELLEIYFHDEMIVSSHRLSEKEDKCDSLTAALQYSEEELNTFRIEKSRADKESLSNCSNLTLALKHAKQNCAELTDQNDEHKRKEWGLAKELEELRWERQNDTNNISKSGSAMLPRTPVSYGGGGGGCGTPGRAIPEQTLLGMLQTENKKLKQELSCLQTNFQLSSQKSTQIRSEAKEAETNLTELQVQFQRVLEEKEAIFFKYEEVRSELKSQSAPKGESERQMSILRERVTELQEDLDHTQKQNVEFQLQMKAEANKVQNGKVLAKRLEGQVISLKDEKKAMEGVMTSLREEFEVMQEELQESSLAKNDVKSKTSMALGALESKASRLTREKGDMFEELAQARKQLDQAHDEIQLLEENRQKLESRLQQKERKIGSLHAQEKQKLNLPGKVEALQDEVFALNEEMEEMRSKNESLESTRASLEDCVSELKKVNKKLSCDISRETRRKEEIVRKITAELEVNEDKVQVLESDVQVKVKECGVLKKKLKDVESDLREVKLSKTSLEENLSGLNLEVRELEENEQVLSSQLKEVRGEKLKERETNTSSDQMMLELESKLEVTGYAVLERESIISDLKCAHELMEMENSTLLTQVTSLSEMVSTRNLQLESQQVSISRQDAELLDIVDKISELEREHGGCRRTINQLMEKIEILKFTQEEGLMEKCALEDKVSALEGEVEGLRTSGSVLHDTNTDLQDKLEELTTKNDSLESDYSELKSQAYTLEQDLKYEVSSLRTSRAELKHAQKLHENDKVEMEETIESLSSKLEDAEHRYEDLHQQKTELMSRLSGMEKRAEELKESCSFMMKERDGVGEQYELLKESALSILLSESMEVVPNEGSENQPAGSGDGCINKGKGPIKKPGTRKVLRNITSN